VSRKTLVIAIVAIAALIVVAQILAAVFPAQPTYTASLESATLVARPTRTMTPSATPVPPTSTPTATATAVPPTATPIPPTATVTVNVDGERRTMSETGIGPVDAAMKAIRKAVNENITLEEYKLSAVTGRSDSIAQVTVMIKDASNAGHPSAGRAVGADIVKTSVDATMEAINRDYSKRCA